jgi:AAA+ superfamily predicted ATPase
MTAYSDITELQRALQKAFNERSKINQQLDDLTSLIQILEEKIKKHQNSFFRKIFSNKASLDSLWLDLEQNRTLKSELEQSLASVVVSIDEFAPIYSLEVGETLVQKFAEMAKSNKIWKVTSIVKNEETKSSAASRLDRTEMTFSISRLPFIQSRFEAMIIQSPTGHRLYLYPNIILQFDVNNKIEADYLSSIEFAFSSQRFIEPRETVPKDATIIDEVWDRVNKDGSPDMRFKGNFKTPVVKYGSIVLKRQDLGETKYHVSNYENSEAFAKVLLNKKGLTKQLSTRPSQLIEQPTENSFTREYYNQLVEFSKDLRAMAGKLSQDEMLISRFSEDTQGLTPSHFIIYCIIYDLCQISKELNEKNYGNNDLEAVGLVLCANQIQPGVETNLLSSGFDKVSFGHQKKMYGDVTESFFSIGNNANPLFINIPETGVTGEEINYKKLKTTFSIPPVLKVLDHGLFDEYIAILYRFANIIAKADNHISDKEKNRLKDIYQQLASPVPPEATHQPVIPGTKETLEETLSELQNLIGLHSVKEEVKTLINFIKIQKARKESGLLSSRTSYHLVFTGNPGTGKTTVARIVAKLFRELGILTLGQVIETDRSGLVAEYVGQTAVKVNRLVDKAINGVLFIDEAYAITSNAGSDFGKEAVATLLKRIEDDRDKLVVIIAGYNTEMLDFLQSNPGFKSRFNRFIVFEDYKPDELRDIFVSLCANAEYRLEADANEKLFSVISDAFEQRNQSFGNGRYIRNLFEKSIERQANRIAAVLHLTKEILTTITKDDIPNK